MIPPVSDALPARWAPRFKGGALLVLFAASVAAGWSLSASPASAQSLLAFPKRPPSAPVKSARQGDPQMLVRADRIDYDYNNQRVAAVGNVQLYYQGSTVEADRVVYDQKTKRLHGEGNVRLIEPDGKVTYGEVLDFSDDFRNGFVDSLRVDAPDQTRLAAARANRSSGNFTVFESGVYTACEPCKDDPKKPPLWQVKAARIIHDQGEKMIYFENARLEFFGMPIAYLPYFSTPDPSVKRKTGFLHPVISASGKYGAAAEIPYFWALAPNYDLTLSPMLTTKQGPLMKAEWRQRLVNGSYMIRGAGIFQLDKDYFLRESGPATPGYRDFRGSVETSGRFTFSDRWAWGWDGTLLTDKTFLQDYHLLRNTFSADPLLNLRTEAVSQLFLMGRGDRSYFDARALHYYGFSEADNQAQLPEVHPVIDHKFTVNHPVMGGQLSFRSNFTSLSRDSADFDPITSAAAATNACDTADPAVRTRTNCLLRGVPGDYTRLSSQAEWKRTFIDSLGQVFTPFLSVRGDVATMNISAQPGVSNFIETGGNSEARFMPTAGVEYRYPFISAHSWGTQTIEPIAQVIVRPNETGIGSFPNEDAQSLVFDDTNLFRIDKYSGWDRVEGGGRANVGVKYRAQMNKAGAVTFTFGQSYQLFGLNSFTAGGSTNTGLDSGLDTKVSDYVAGATYQPNSVLTFASHFRFDHSNFTVRRFEFETTASLGRWTGTVLYGNYDAQPDLGLLTRRQGVLGSGLLKMSENWSLLGAARYDIEASKFNQTTIGLGYMDDCFLMAVNYVTDYSYSGNPVADRRVMLQIGLRTLGTSAVNSPTSALTGGL